MHGYTWSVDVTILSLPAWLEAPWKHTGGSQYMLVELNRGREHLLLGFIPSQGFPAGLGEQITPKETRIEGCFWRWVRQETGMSVEAQAWAQWHNQHLIPLKAFQKDRMRLQAPRQENRAEGQPVAFRAAGRPSLLSYGWWVQRWQGSVVWMSRRLPDFVLLGKNFAPSIPVLLSLCLV